jgi:hypothetical protein
MKDFDDQKAGGPRDAALPISKSRGKAPARARDAGHVVSEIASRAKPDADALRSAELSHPANAAPLADLLGQLQHSHGNSFVQRVVADLNQTNLGVEGQSSDQPRDLDGGVRSEMESAFGENFGDVRIHTGGEARRITQELNARAVTRGRDVYFGKGEYDPITVAGKEVLAHELTHVAQQTNRAGKSSSSSVEAAEAEAHVLGRRVAHGGHAQVNETADAALAYRIGPQPTLPPVSHPTMPPSPTPAPPLVTPAPPQQATFEFTVTPVIQTSFPRLLNEPAFEAEQIELYVAPEYDRWRVIINMLIQRFPAAFQDIIRQRPTNLDESLFLRTVGNHLWELVRSQFLQIMDQKYRSNPSFKRRVDRARRLHDRPVNIPADATVV